MRPSELTSIASHAFIRGYEKATGNPPSGILYNAFMTSFRRDSGQGARMELPCCWFRWGEEVVRQHVGGLRWDHEEAGLSTVTWQGDAPLYSSDAFTASVLRFIEGFICRYSGQRGHEEAMMDASRFFPYEFQNEYRSLLETLRGNDFTIGSAQRETLDPVFRKTMTSLPPEFSCIDPEVGDFSRIFILAVQSGLSRDSLVEMAEDFWVWFCHHLRIRCNENIPEATIDEWREKIPWVDEMYARNLQDRAFELTGGVSGDPRIQEALEAREARMMELERILETFSDELMEGFEDFVTGCRR